MSTADELTFDFLAPFKANFTDSPFYTNKDGADDDSTFESTPKPINMPNSPHTFIKDESHGHDFTNFSMSPPSHNNQPFTGFNTSGSVDPSELTMGQGGRFGGFQGFNNNNNMPGGGGGFLNGTISDDELLSLGNLDEHTSGQMGDFNELEGMFTNMHNHSQSVPVNVGQAFSHTPENAPSESPFIRGFPGAAHFNRQQLHHHHSYSGNVESPSSFNAASPLMRSSSSDMERVGSHRSPVMSPKTPKTPAIAGLSISTGDSSSLPIQNHHLSHHRHQKSLSGNWEGAVGSLSYIESPLSSPGHTNHAQIAEMLKSGKHASLPAKVEGAPGGTNIQSQEAKRRRRRESHNMVERRRRDNINERIQELSHLVPQHRLEDEKVRKHLVNNTPLSPSITTSGSPSRATSLLAGGMGRRASGVGSAVTSMPSEEKDKGPNKGDILNGAVGWTRDLMWSLQKKIDQEKKLKEIIAQLGGTFPFESTEEDIRMEAEIDMAIKRNGKGSYTRGPGSGLRVPGYTDLAGAPLSQSGEGRPSASRNNSQQNVVAGNPQPQYWTTNPSGGDNNANNNGDITFKEEEEFGMDMS